MLATTAALVPSTRLAVLDLTARIVAHETTAWTRAAKLLMAIATMAVKAPNTRAAPQAPTALTAATAIEAMLGVEAAAEDSTSPFI